MREFEEKIKRIQQLLEIENLYGCYIKRQDNFAWLTCGGINYVGPGDEGNCGLFVTQERLYAITNNIEAPRMKEEEKLEEFGFEIISGIWYDRNHERNTLFRLCGQKPFGADRPGYGKDLSIRLKSLRTPLTPEEVSRYLKGGKLVSTIMEETAASIRSGETEWAVASKVAGRAWEEGIEPLSVFCSSDERILHFRHAISTRKVIQERIQLGCNMRYYGLVIGCTRFISLKPVNDSFRKQYLDNTQIGCEMINQTRPGLSYTVPLLAGKAMYEQLGYEKEFSMHHQGGSIGYQPRECRVDFDCTENIANNQAFCWNPTITGTKSEDTIITTENGIQFVTTPCFFPVIKLKIGSHIYTRADILEKF